MWVCLLKKVQLRGLFVSRYILPDELPQNLRRRNVVRLAGVKKSFVQIRFNANTKACCFPHCGAIGYTFFEAAVYALDLPGSSGFGGDRSGSARRAGLPRTSSAACTRGSRAGNGVRGRRVKNGFGAGRRRPGWRVKKGRRIPAALELFRRKAFRSPARPGPIESL